MTLCVIINNYSNPKWPALVHPRGLVEVMTVSSCVQVSGVGFSAAGGSAKEFLVLPRVKLHKIQDHLGKSLWLVGVASGHDYPWQGNRG